MNPITALCQLTLILAAIFVGGCMDNDGPTGACFYCSSDNSCWSERPRDDCAAEGDVWKEEEDCPSDMAQEHIERICQGGDAGTTE